MAVLALYGRHDLTLGYTTLCTARHCLEAAGLLGCHPCALFRYPAAMDLRLVRDEAAGQVVETATAAEWVERLPAGVASGLRLYRQ